MLLGEQMMILSQTKWNFKAIVYDSIDQVSKSRECEKKSKTGEGQRDHSCSQQRDEINCT